MIIFESENGFGVKFKSNVIIVLVKFDSFMLIKINVIIDFVWIVVSVISVVVSKVLMMVLIGRV